MTNQAEQLVTVTGTLPDRERVQRGLSAVTDQLLAWRTDEGHWVGELSTSALATATAIVALTRLQAAGVTHSGERELADNIRRGIEWLRDHQNEDGGWGDTVRSFSNISTSMLCHAAFHAADSVDENREAVDRAAEYIEQQGGVPALIARYGRDKTFSIPILTHCALAGTGDWSQITQLPFEMACVPARFYKTVRLPVVSYALPALIAIGQARHHFRPTRVPGLRWLRNRAIAPSLRVLEQIQPPNGGFLEATPLTSFVTMSLASIGLHEHVVARRGLEFILNSVRPDGSWPIDTNLATWVTTLSVNALEERLPAEKLDALLDWLLKQQYREVHPYTNADPGGWAWTDLPGGVPDADDTPGAMLAVIRLSARVPGREADVQQALSAAGQWLLDLQNSDGGWPTFCRGWGKLPFDRSSSDLTAHCIRALLGWMNAHPEISTVTKQQIDNAISYGLEFLRRQQRPDGSWLPLWFGNQHLDEEENPTYGTTRVLKALDLAGEKCTRQKQAARKWLKTSQNADGGWGGGQGSPSSVEETALAVEALVGDQTFQSECGRGVAWLLESVERGRASRATPIGFYFAKLWYFESLYPLVYAVSALKTYLDSPTTSFDTEQPEHAPPHHLAPSGRSTEIH